MLTEDMTRLCEDIVALRRRRREMQAAFEREAGERSECVKRLCRELSGARAEMAKRTRGERRAFLRHLRHEVHGQRREMRSDLAGVRRVWAGKAA